MRGTRRTMTAMSLREAATATGTAKSTILRAIKSGRISATRTESGGYEIDPSELARVYGPLRTHHAEHRSVGQDAPPPAPDATDNVAALLERVRALESLLSVERERRADLERDRDRWAAQAERLALAPPSPPAPATSAPSAWWKRLVG